MAVVITRLGQTKDLLGESPFWDDIDDCLYWIDSVAGKIQRLHVQSGTLDVWAVPAPIGSIAPAEKGSLIVALKSEFALLDLLSGSLRRVGSIGVDHPEVRLNDGKVNGHGGFICGTMHSSRQPGDAIEGGVYRVGADLTITRLAEAVGIANGTCFSPDGRTMYLSDSGARQFWAFDLNEAGEPVARRPFADTSELGSGVDGATVDSMGRIWGSLVRAGKIACFLPDGTIDRLIDVPLTHPTSLCFGGPDLDRLFVTSISRSTHLSAPEEIAGAVLVIDGLDVQGRRVDRFGAVSGI